jgi:hypothetical protein
MSKPKSNRQQPDLFQRLAQLPARERKEALAVHHRVSDDPRLSDVTRAHARHVADTLEKLIERILGKT